MCRQVQCQTCKRPTWAGCGAHVEQVLGGVPAGERCQCRTGGRPGATAATADASADPKAGGWLGRLLSR